MPLAEKFTKKRMADITKFEDRIDLEYLNRIDAIETRRHLIDVLDDFQEWLPEGLQAFREADDDTFKELLFQIRRIIDRVRNKREVPMEPTEAYMFCAPPLLSLPRSLAVMTGVEAKRRNPGSTIIPMTWGQAFLRLSMEGEIKNIMEQQEKQYRKVIEIKKQIEEKVDTEW